MGTVPRHQNCVHLGDIHRYMKDVLDKVLFPIFSSKRQEEDPTDLKFAAGLSFQ